MFAIEIKLDTEYKPKYVKPRRLSNLGFTEADEGDVKAGTHLFRTMRDTKDIQLSINAYHSNFPFGNIEWYRVCEMNSWTNYQSPYKVIVYKSFKEDVK